MKKIMLIDGLSILNRAFYALPIMSTKGGEYTNAVLGFLNIFVKLYDEEAPGHVAVAFDLPAPTFRHGQFEGYKATRKPMPAELRPQIGAIKAVLAAMGVAMASVEGFEADDVLGTLARIGENAGFDVVIISGDRDLLQIATDRIKIRVPKTVKGQNITEDYFAADVLARLGVGPAEYIEVKGLMGDASDNIPGVDGIGEKTATKIIQNYGTIENAIAHAAEIKPARAAANLAAQADIARLSRDLAAIRADAPVDNDMEKYVIGDIFNDNAIAEFARLELNSLVRKYGGKTAKTKESEAPAISGITLCADGARDYFTKLSPPIAYILTNSGDGAFCGADGRPVYLPKTHFSLARDFFDSDIPKIGFGAKGDIHHLRGLGFELRGLAFDGLIAGYVLGGLNDGAKIEDLARQYLGYKIQRDAAPVQLTFEDIQNAPDEKQTRAELAFARVAALAAAYPIMDAELKATGQERLYYDIELPLTAVLADMEMAGIGLDAGFLKSYGEKLQTEIDRLLADIHNLAGQEFNPNSPKQVGRVLFEDLKLPGGRKTKTGYSTTAEVLQKLAANHEIAAKLLEYRSHAKLKSTYIDGLLSQINPATSRIHTTFNQAVTATGRISSAEPNMQNIPIRTPLGRELRRAFIPAAGKIFVDADYSQIELRILAELSGDPTFLAAFRDGADIHAITAAQVFHVNLADITPEQRGFAKAVNFGIIYGISAYSLAEDLGISVKAAGEYIEGYFAKYTQIKQYLDESIEAARRDGFATTIFGRRRRLNEISSANFNTRSFGERAAMNMPVQGSAADIIKIAMVKVHSRLLREGLQARLLLQVHDELLLEAPPDEADKIKQILQEEMAGAVNLNVPLAIDIAIGKNWYESK